MLIVVKLKSLVLGAGSAYLIPAALRKLLSF